MKKFITIIAMGLLAGACTAPAAGTSSQPSSQQPSQDQQQTPPATTPPASNAPMHPVAPPTSVSGPVTSAPSTTSATIVPTSDGYIMENAEWGNNSLILDIGTDSSTVTFECSGGTIDEPFRMVNADDGHSFSLSGTYHPGGPPRATIDPNTGEPVTPDYGATYSGFLGGQGDTTMDFTITPHGGTPMDYELTQGKFTMTRQACPL